MISLDVDRIVGIIGQGLESKILLVQSASLGFAASAVLNRDKCITHRLDREIKAKRGGIATIGNSSLLYRDPCSGRYVHLFRSVETRIHTRCLPR
jgi:hypothetical protein